jgi:hypothetical protein
MHASVPGSGFLLSKCDSTSTPIPINALGRLASVNQKRGVARLASTLAESFPHEYSLCLALRKSRSIV